MIETDDFRVLGEAFTTLYLQALNGVVCGQGSPCGHCSAAWEKGKEVLDKYDPEWGDMHRSGSSFQHPA